ncbi:MAG: hypothetical protein IT184_12505 [Acidobacteria bacterium]|nr:hypothetical protein [Acidobacteriota bacterium]
MQRREFLVGAVAAAGLSRRAAASTAARRAAQDRIAIMTLNFMALLKLPGQPPSPERTLEVLDLPEMIADTYGVHNLEFQHYHFPSTEPSYYRDVKARVDKARSRVSQVVMEFGGLNISAPDHNFLPRIQAIDLTKVWIDRAVMLGCPRVMVNQGQPSPENRSYAVDTLRAMVAYGTSRGVRVSLEPRGGGAGRGGAPPSAPSAAPMPPAPAVAPAPAQPAWTLLDEIIKAAGAHWNIDLGGIGAATQEELHAALRVMLPSSHDSMHIKRSANWDVATAVGFIRESGYAGLYSIEARGHDATRDIFNVLMATL